MMGFPEQFDRELTVEERWAGQMTGAPDRWTGWVRPPFRRKNSMQNLIVIRRTEGNTESQLRRLIADGNGPRGGY